MARGQPFLHVNERHEFMLSKDRQTVQTTKEGNSHGHILLSERYFERTAESLGRRRNLRIDLSYEHFARTAEFFKDTRQ